MPWLAFTLPALVFVVLILLAYRRRWPWTGLAEIRRPKQDDEEIQPAKTLWDWLQLLVIPLMLLGLAFFINKAQAERAQRDADDSAREKTLRTYLNQMSGLMLDHRLLRSHPLSDVRVVARTATLTALRRLDGERKAVVVHFLSEARLLGQDSSNPSHAAIHLADSDLTGVDLRGAFLAGATLIAADLRRADLSHARLWGAYLSGADLRDADLRGADLRAYSGTSRDRPRRTADVRLGRGAVLRQVDLRHADLRGAYLQGVDLVRADLREADLRGAHLGGADLRGARRK